MIQNIIAQIDNINSSLEWIKKNKPSDYEQKFILLVEERRKLKKLKAACAENPAIAAFGISQVGKSYLMNCILQKDGKPFQVEADGTRYKFIEEMNPKVTNTEATGVVTRFSSFSRNSDRYSPEYPFLMKCLSVADVIMILSDGYYNDINDYTTYSDKEIEELTIRIYDKYRDMPVISPSPITPDNIMDIRAYYAKHINNAQAFLHTNFFDRLSLIADRIPEKDWANVFSVLWHRSEYQTKLFTKLTGTLSRLQFASYVYLPAQALLHGAINENTVMSVDCLTELFLDSPRYYTDAYLRNGNSYQKIEHIAKSEICAICAEIVVKIADEYLEDTNKYSLCNITDTNVIAELSKDREKLERLNPVTNKLEISYETAINVLRENDLLDFPGARSRKKEQLATMKENKILINVLLRGKIAYLFNMYNESQLINILLYCHHHEQNDVTNMPLLLNDWIKNYVGKTMEERKKTMELTGGISPLFYVGTKFNIDMEYNTEDIANSMNALNGRWQARFEKVLYHQCFNADGSLDDQQVKIFLNWTRSGETFNNSYVLRDFKFSGPLASKLYEGENTDAKKMLIPQSHYDLLRETFCSSKAVRRFFPFPELSWDVCASINNDGAQYIIAQLSKIASRMDVTRNERFRAMLGAIVRRITDVMQAYFISTDVDTILENNIKKAKSIFREMDFTCNSDNYYFGHLLQALQLTEADSYKVVHDMIQSPEMNDKVNDFKDYEIIRNSCKNAGFPIEGARKDEDKWNCIINTYGFSSKEEAEEFLTRKHIEVSKLFDGSFERKMNSCILADAVFDKWCSDIKSVEFYNELSNEGSFDNNVMTMLVDNVIQAAYTLKLRDTMAKAIAEYVNVINKYTALENLLADILASLINDFIMDFGCSYLSDGDMEKAKKICKERKLSALSYVGKERTAKFTEEELTNMFEEMSTHPQALIASFDDNYNKWLEYMFISFVAHLDIPDFDHQANQQLASILEHIQKAS